MSFSAEGMARLERMVELLQRRDVRGLPAYELDQIAMAGMMAIRTLTAPTSETEPVQSMYQEFCRLTDVCLDVSAVLLQDLPRKTDAEIEATAAEREEYFHQARLQVEALLAQLKEG